MKAIRQAKLWMQVSNCDACVMSTVAITLCLSVLVKCYTEAIIKLQLRQRQQ